ncbi:MAG: hypothetical protein HY378_00055 [Candidatus Brennerbacteria bacterium]|nr:hypothetical protein [Candidatus Brennerbacteria bacterium]
MRKDKAKTYLETLKERQKESRVYRIHQATGLTLAEILEDEKHKSLYMKLAKVHDAQKLIELAKDVAARKNVRNKGAYFMRLLTKDDIRKYENIRRYENKKAGHGSKK